MRLIPANTAYRHPPTGYIVLAGYMWRFGEGEYILHDIRDADGTTSVQFSLDKEEREYLFECARVHHNRVVDRIRSRR
jgi:hypothetical protein